MSSLGRNVNTRDDYQLIIDGKERAGFSRISGITMQMQTVSYAEGGADGHTHELPGQVAHAELTLERGMTEDRSLWRWMQKVQQGTVVRKDITVKITRTPQGEATWGWHFYDAYPKAWTGPELAGTTREGDGVAFEALKLVHNGFEEIRDM